MQDIEWIIWTPAQRDLWNRISAHDFEPAGQVLTFTRRLARDRGWTLDFARGAIDEYRRFCFLAIVAGIDVTPSEEVDEVWHQHLTYSRDYWMRWCPTVLHTDLHHQPTKGGSDEKIRFASQYAATLALYEAYFGPPDRTYWPGTADRFRTQPRYRIVDSDHAIVMRLPRGLKPLLRRVGSAAGLLGVVLLVTTGPAGAQSANPLDWTAGPFLTLYVVLAIGTILAAFAIRGFLADPGSPGQKGDLGPIELAYLAGGPTRAADTLAVALLESGAASFDKKTGVVTIDADGRVLPEFVEPYRSAASGMFRRSDLVRTLAPWFDAMKLGLVARGLVPQASRIGRIRVATACILGPVVCLGIAKIVVGASRDKPTGWLVVLVVLVVAAGLLMMVGVPRRTLAGGEALLDYQERHDRAARAPLAGEFALAFALTGPAALAGTVLADYAGLLKQSDSGGGCGGGGDGGGCGGCSGG